MTLEDRFVAKLSELLAPSDRVRVGPGDDAAVVAGNAAPLVATTDMLVEGVDFLAGEQPERLGRRAAAVNLSDLAAMGARPDFFLLSIAFPADRGWDFPLALAQGAIERAGGFGAQLVGGDLSDARTTVVSVALWGRLEADPLLRSGARAGDLLFVSGHPGRAAAGLHLARRIAVFASRGAAPTPRIVGLTPPQQDELLAAYHDPEPRVALGLLLAREGIGRATIDVSDGLGMDTGRLARASGVRAVIEKDRLPISSSLAAFCELEGEDPIDWILAGGDDYELLFAAGPDALSVLERAEAEAGVSIAHIGRIESGEGAVLADRQGERDIGGLGHDHFARASRRTAE